MAFYWEFERNIAFSLFLKKLKSKLSNSKSWCNSAFGKRSQEDICVSTP